MQNGTKTEQDPVSVKFSRETHIYFGDVDPGVFAVVE